MLRRIFALFIVAGFLSGCNSLNDNVGVDGLTLTREGKSDYVIMVDPNATEAEKFAAAELSEFIQQSTGATLPVKEEKPKEQGGAIYVGQTKFASESGVDFDKLGPEEWVIRSIGDDVIITGGRPRGTLYGAYEFLEKNVGARFLDPYTTRVPKNGTFRVQRGLDERNHPSFNRREILMVVGGASDPTHRLFEVRRKLNSFGNADRPNKPEWGGSVRYGSPYATHTHHRYVNDFPEAFKDHPEYFALTEKGSRAKLGENICQVCMSHPEVRRIFARKMRHYIEEDRRKLRKQGREDSFPTLYSLVPDDGTGGKCFCGQCLAKAKKHDSYSGVVLDFTNEIADDVAKDYPDVTLVTGVYTYFRDIPTGVEPRDSVLPCMAQLGAEFNTKPRRDTLRSIHHPLNAEAKKEIADWAKLNGSLGFHDYWTAWSQSYQWPHTNIRGLAETLKFYAANGVNNFLVEDEMFGTRIHNFVDLQLYLGSKLLQNPNLDEEAIIDEFMSGYYGPAADPMTKLLDYIETRQDEEDGYLATVPPASRAYFDRDYFIETDALLKQAENLAADDPVLLANVRQERLAIDETMLHLWDSLKEGGDWPFKRDKVLERLRENYDYVNKKYGGWGKKYKTRDEDCLAYLANMPPIPEQFKNKKIIDLCGPKLRLGSGKFAEKVDDPHAATGKAWRLTSKSKGKAGEHRQLPVFGLFDGKSGKEKKLVKQVIISEEMPKDENYHWYYVGRMKASKSVYLWAHHSWRLAQRLPIYNSALPDQPDYDVYASIKLEGPAYAPDSKKPNSFSIDRVILFEADETNNKKLTKP